MSKIIKSIFGSYADRLQVMVDNNLNRFAPTWYQEYFDWGLPTVSLDFKTVIGRNRIEAAASIIEMDAPAPLRSRLGLESLSGEVPVIAEKMKLTQKDYRDFLTLQNMPLIAADLKKQQILDLVWGDAKRVGDSLFKRVDLMAMEAVSTGQITLTTTNNPDGTQAPTAIDLFMPSGNKINANILWATSATATPFKDIFTVVQYGKTKGISFSKILMDSSLWYTMAKTQEVIDTLSAFLRLTIKQTYPTVEAVNDYLRSQKWPVIELMDHSIGIEKDGAITAINPFSVTNAVFIPDGKLGIIHNALTMEQIQPIAGISYATLIQGRGLLSKWSSNEPFEEWTKGELIAMPGVEAVDSICLLSATKAY